jgi:hypothetical protein
MFTHRIAGLVSSYAEFMTYIDRFQNAILALMTRTMALVTLIVTLDVIYSLGTVPVIAPSKPANQ